MDFKQIEAFVKVVETASFSKAAEELHVSQPSVSIYITSHYCPAKLEENSPKPPSVML